MNRAGPIRLLIVSAAVAALVCAVVLFSPAAPAPQEREVVATLASGRVTIWVARDGIVVAAVGTEAEAGAHPPLLVPISSRRMAIILGAAEWGDAAGTDSMRLDVELNRLMGAVAASAGPSISGAQAEDIEQTGMLLLEPLRAAAGRIFDRIPLAPDEPLVEVILIGYVTDYGPEVWTLRYRAVQEMLRGDYWRTRVLRPLYTQHYPPERGEPRTLIDLRYPPDDPAPTLRDLLARRDPRVAALHNEAVERMLAGQAHRVKHEEASAVVRAALVATADADAPRALAVLDEQRGFAWLIAPPEPLEQVEAERAERDREPGAPTLRRPAPRPPN
jgi:hypothetical protein